MIHRAYAEYLRRETEAQMWARIRGPLTWEERSLRARAQKAASYAWARYMRMVGRGVGK